MEKSWKEYDEINLGPQHEAERIIHEEIEREMLDDNIRKGE